MESSYLMCLRSQGCQGRFGLRLPDCWDYTLTLTHCTDVHYARKEHRQFRLVKEKGEGEDKRKAPREPFSRLKSQQQMKKGDSGRLA